MTATAQVLISCVQLQRTIDDYRASLEAEGLQVRLPEVRGQHLSEAEMLDLVEGVDGIIAGDDEITRSVIERSDRLRIISKWGVGLDAIDLEAAAERGIAVTNTPGMFGDEVADVVIGYLVMLARGLHRIDAAVREGSWLKPQGRSLAGQTIGIVGMGDIGLEVARRCLALRMRVIGAEVMPERASAAAMEGVEVAELASLLGEADIVSLNCPLTSATFHVLDGRALAGMKTGVWIVNTARGALIDEAALVQELTRGHVGAAALDVFEQEPLPLDSPLRELDNVILGTHNSSNTREAVRRTSLRAIENLLIGLGRVA